MMCGNGSSVVVVGESEGGSCDISKELGLLAGF
jgi:hypothetical protein